jgi:hypothetical protein
VNDVACRPIAGLPDWAVKEVADRNGIMQETPAKKASVPTSAMTVVIVPDGDLSKRKQSALSGPPGEFPGENLVVILPGDDDTDPAIRAWLAADGNKITAVKQDDDWRLSWRPGRAVIRSATRHHESLLAAVVAVDSADRQLRKIDAAITPVETAAPGDVDFAYTISMSHWSRWKRFDRTIKDLYQQRLSLAKFDPAGAVGSDRVARRALDRLSIRLRLDNRAEVLSDRLEALEDLYEGAVDRIVDHRWYVIGITVEVLIVILLAAETALLLARSGR